MRKFLRKILDLLFPQSLSVTAVEALAQGHRLSTLPGASPCPSPWMYALFDYSDMRVRALVWQIKYKGNLFLTEAVGKLLSEEILESVADQQFFNNSEWIMVSIPASKKHQREKGFNQTELMAKAILKAGADQFITYEARGLQKIRQTKAQREMKSKEERRRNVYKSFEAVKTLSGKNVMLIDDVITTGSTLEEARRALLEVGARSVVAFALAH